MPALELELLQVLRMSGETSELLGTMLPDDLVPTPEQLDTALRRLEGHGLVERSVEVDGIWWDLTERGRAAAVRLDPEDRE